MTIVFIHNGVEKAAFIVQNQERRSRLLDMIRVRGFAVDRGNHEGTRDFRVDGPA